MPQTPVTVDLARLGALADRIQAAADTITASRPALPPWDAAPGSAIATATGPTGADAQLADLIGGLKSWATAARSSTGVLADADERSARRM